MAHQSRSARILCWSRPNCLRAISLRSGKELWSFAATGTYISPAIADRTVIGQKPPTKGRCSRLILMKQLRAFTPKRLAFFCNIILGLHLTSPVVSDGLVYIGGGKKLHALDAASGETRWEYSGTDYVASSATVGNGRVFISNATTILALDQRTGTLIWKQPITFAIYFAPVVAGDTVYITTGDNVRALDTATGAKRWEKGIAQESLRPGAVQGKYIFVKSTSTLMPLTL